MIFGWENCTEKKKKVFVVGRGGWQKGQGRVHVGGKLFSANETKQTGLLEVCVMKCYVLELIIAVFYVLTSWAFSGVSLSKLPPPSLCLSFPGPPVTRMVLLLEKKEKFKELFRKR